jgi:phage terminase Nu1 subunit (DNA packaging protein)
MPRTNNGALTPAQKLAIERTRLTALRCERDTLELAVGRGRLLDKDVIQAQGSMIAVAIRQKLLSIPSKVSRELVGASYEDIHNTLSVAIREALTELSGFHKKVVDPDWEPEE